MKLNSEPTPSVALPPASRVTRPHVTRPVLGFTLVELLIVISIIGVIAAFTLVAIGSLTRIKKINAAKTDLNQIESALENYKAKYGVYPPGNHNPDSFYSQPGTPWLRASMMNQLYYELSGTVLNSGNFVTLDGSISIPAVNVSQAYGTGGFLNCTKGAGEDAAVAKNFLPGLKPQQTSLQITNHGVLTTMLITTAGTPDAAYQPLAINGENPVRYVYPGVQNPGSYDLWVQLVIKGKTNLVCNWSSAAQINTAFP